MIWNKITNPKTLKKVNVNSKKGIEILKKYIKQIGGSLKLAIAVNSPDTGIIPNVESLKAKVFVEKIIPETLTTIDLMYSYMEGRIKTEKTWDFYEESFDKLINDIEEKYFNKTGKINMEVTKIDDKMNELDKNGIAFQKNVAILRKKYTPRPADGYLGDPDSLAYLEVLASRHGMADGTKGIRGNTGQKKKNKKKSELDKLEELELCLDLDDQKINCKEIYKTTWFWFNIIKPLYISSKTTEIIIKVKDNAKVGEYVFDNETKIPFYVVPDRAYNKEGKIGKYSQEYPYFNIIKIDRPPHIKHRLLSILNKIILKLNTFEKELKIDENEIYKIYCERLNPNQKKMTTILKNEVKNIELYFDREGEQYGEYGGKELTKQFQKYVDLNNIINILGSMHFMQLYSLGLYMTSSIVESETGFRNPTEFPVYIETEISFEELGLFIEEFRKLSDLVLSEDFYTKLEEHKLFVKKIKEIEEEIPKYKTLVEENKTRLQTLVEENKTRLQTLQEKFKQFDIEKAVDLTITFEELKAFLNELNKLSDKDLYVRQNEFKLFEILLQKKEEQVAYFKDLIKQNQERLDIIKVLKNYYDESDSESNYNLSPSASESESESPRYTPSLYELRRRYETLINSVNNNQS